MSLNPSNTSISPPPSRGSNSPSNSTTVDSADQINGTLVPRLARHLIAAKRSLASASLVQRADTLVSTARSNVEDIAALSARNVYLRDYVGRELRVLEQIRFKLENIKETGAAEFTVVLRELDVSGDRVEETLRLLKTTLVEPSFQASKSPSQPAGTAASSSAQASPEDGGGIGSDARKTGTSAEHSAESTEQKCLYDFVSEQGVDDITSIFRKCIDATNDATADLVQSIEEFDASLQAIKSLLRYSVSLSTSVATLQTNESDQKLQRVWTAERRGNQQDQKNDSRDNQSSSSSTKRIPALFRSLESHATEIAGLLQSLVHHYDLCVTALKYTEGGGEAAAEAHAQAQVDMPNGIEELANRDAPLEPVSQAELAEMIEVLDKDALEVDDVVQDIRSHASQMQTELEAILSEAKKLKIDYSRLRKAIQQLEDLGRKLSAYVSAGSTFLDRWAAQRARIGEKLEELENVRNFYQGFLGAYDGLILEIGRRKIIQAKMEKVLSDAMTKVSKLHDEDAEEREAFKSEQGEFLPSDIWPGLTDPPIKFEIQRVEGRRNSLPEVSKEAMQRAMQRLGKRI